MTEGGLDHGAPGYPGFSQNERYHNPSPDPGVTVVDGRIIDQRLPGIYRINSNDLEQTMSFSLFTNEGDNVAVIYTMLNDGYPVPQGKITIQIRSILEFGNLTARASEVRSHLTMKKFVSAAAALPRFHKSRMPVLFVYNPVSRSAQQ